METQGHDERSVARRRALADLRRAALVRELELAPDGRDVEDLASSLGVHPNTVRWHLGVLADAGLVVTRSSREHHRPGRPRIIYQLRPEAAAAADEHRLLATVLTDAVAELEDGGERAERAGCVWGRHIAGAERCSGDADGALPVLVDLLEVQGFAPSANGNSIEMRRCPLHDLAETQPEVVCAVHRGLIAGALEELRSPLVLGSLRPFVEPDLCVAELRPRIQD
jgi:predicted ArsR family transcriptional regulator